jgi:hypothetical protein
MNGNTYSTNAPISEALNNGYFLVNQNSELILFALGALFGILLGVIFCVAFSYVYEYLRKKHGKKV